MAELADAADSKSSEKLSPRKGQMLDFTDTKKLLRNLANHQAIPARKKA
jgi:hypothetical protein